MAEQTSTISRGQLEALKAGIRAAAEANPSRSQNKAQRCAEFTRTICGSFGYLRRLADLPAQCFPAAMNVAAQLAKPVRVEGTAEASLKSARAGLDAVLADLIRARQGVARFRREAEAALLAPLKSALEVDGKGILEAVVQDGVGYLLGMPFLQMEHDLDRMHEWLNVLATRLPSIGKALDDRRAVPSMLSAD